MSIESMGFATFARESAARQRAKLQRYDRAPLGFPVAWMLCGLNAPCIESSGL
jgi:hypothetical protein